MKKNIEQKEVVLKEMIFSKHLKIIENLKEGNKRYVKGEMANFKSNNLLVESREKLIKKQNPEVAVLSCADSRVVPEFIFDKNMGEIFVLRLAGNGITPEVVASLEFSVMHLGVQVIVIMGHESCGAINAHCSLQLASQLEKAEVGKAEAKKTQASAEKRDGERELVEKDNFAHLFKSLRPSSLEEIKKLKNKDIDINDLSRENAKWGIEKLLQESNYFNESFLAEKVSFLPCYYSLSSGQVEFLS